MDATFAINGALLRHNFFINRIERKYSFISYTRTESQENFHSSLRTAIHVSHKIPSIYKLME